MLTNRNRKSYMSDKKKKQPEVKAVTPPGTAAYTWLAKADEGGKYLDGKFKTWLVLPGDTDVAYLEEKALEAAANEWPKAKPASIRLAFLKDGDEIADKAKEKGKDKEEFRGKVIIDAKSKFQPQIVGAGNKDLPEGVEVRSGDTVKLSIQFYACEVSGQKTVTAQLRAVKLIEKNNRGGNYGDDFEDEDEGYVPGTSSSSNDKQDGESPDDGDF